MSNNHIVSILQAANRTSNTFILQVSAVIAAIVVQSPIIRVNI